jgi:beta-ureidopropionase / N-carbamoyl-L-amino-acid hydrolase
MNAFPAIPEVDPDRIRQRLQAFARIGYQPDGSVTRLAFTRADLQARELLIHYLSSLRLDVHIDQFGNIFGERVGADSSLEPVLVGSHLDTVPNGGRFDGSLGVVAALETISVLDGAGLELPRGIQVVSFSCEESSRFGVGTLGSELVAGVIAPEKALALEDSDGVSVAKALRSAGFDPDKLDMVRRQPGDFRAFVELHIEQGRVLEEEDKSVGIVESIAAPTRFRVEVIGRPDHSGATPMHLRNDALTGSAEMILLIERAAQESESSVGTVGTMRVLPNAMNVVPGRAIFDVDLRGGDIADKRRTLDRIEAGIDEIVTRRGLQVSRRELTHQDPVAMNPEIVELLMRHCDRREIGHRLMLSGAGHDAMQMAQICPAGMVLVPSSRGISHAREEWTDPLLAVPGIQALVDTVLELAAS